MPLLDDKAIEAITQILKRGNNVEIKKVQGNVEVVEIKRKLICKTLKTG